MGVGNFFGMLPEEMRNSRLYGVELDAISGRIAKKLYPNANITIAGFESTDRRDFFDLAIGNVPFGNYRVSDKPYDKLGFSIHNYFFAKALDQVRPGGVVAFVTSRYTLDQQSPDVRKYLAQKAELLGAIRLPNNAFRANAGTDVVSDIIFLQKREHPIDIEPDWVHLGMTEEGYVLNSYFIRHPEMILGELTMQTTQYGKEECTVIPKDGLELSKLLQEAITHIHGKYEEVLNLLDNGRKAMDGKGVLEVIGKVEDQGYALYVRDSGKGMPKEEIPRITEAFYMIDKSRARSQGGAGLGLSLCMEIVKRHGGTLEFQSEEGVGTTARIFLPEEGENK